MKKTISIVLILILVLSLGVISFASSAHYKVDRSKISSDLKWREEINDNNSDGLKQWTISFGVYSSDKEDVAEIINQYCVEKKCVPVSVSSIECDDESYTTIIAVVSKK